jgi:hypothetical protein
VTNSAHSGQSYAVGFGRKRKNDRARAVDLEKEAREVRAALLPDADRAQRGTADTPPTDLLKVLMSEHLDAPFPASVEKGEDYGLVDAVMVGADIYGWCLSIANGRSLPPDDLRRFRRLRDDLHQSLGEFPEDARPNYAQLVEMATVALGERA